MRAQTTVLSTIPIQHEERLTSHTPPQLTTTMVKRDTPGGDAVDLASLSATNETNVPVWVVTHGGYKSAILLRPTSSERSVVLLMPQKQEVEVNTRDLERANPVEFDRVEDLIDLRFINECSATHTLVQRFGSSQVYTYAAGPSLVAINPMTSLNIYSEAVMDLFTGCQHRRDMPPHVFSVAQLVLSRLTRSVTHVIQCSNGRSMHDPTSSPTIVCQQAICFTGRSGSGKTRASLDVLCYLLHQSNRVMAAKFSTTTPLAPTLSPARVTAERLRALFSMLDAFTCSRVVLNTNASRTGRLISVEFVSLDSTLDSTPDLVIAGLTTRLVLFDRSRVTDRPEGEPNFHIFYYFLAGLDQHSRKALHLLDTDEPNLFMTKLHRAEDKEAARVYWLQLCRNARLLGFNMDDEWLVGGISRLLAIIFHLGCADCVEYQQTLSPPSTTIRTSSPYSKEVGFKHMKSAEYAADLLGCSVEELTKAVFGMPDEVCANCLDNLKGFVQGLYQTAVDVLVMLLNRCLSSRSALTHGDAVCAQLLIYDPVGYQSPPSIAPDNPASRPSSLFDLCVNYANDRLGLLFDETVSKMDRNRMEAEGLMPTATTVDVELAQDLVKLLDYTDNFAKSDGLFRAIEEAASMGDSKYLRARIEDLYQKERATKPIRDLRTVRRVKRSGAFVLNHSLSSLPIEYGLDEGIQWLAGCRLTSSALRSQQLLRHHSVPTIRSVVSALQTDRDYLGDARPTWMDNPSIFLHMKHQLDGLLNRLRTCAKTFDGPNAYAPSSGFNDGGSASGLQWIHCLLPVINAGLCQLISGSETLDYSPKVLLHHTQNEPVLSAARICVNLVRAQLRGLNLISVLQSIRTGGYPDRLTNGDFRLRYTTLVPRSLLKQALITNVNEADDKQVIKTVLSSLQYSSQSYLIGKEHVFLRSHILPQLEMRKKSTQTAYPDTLSQSGWSRTSATGENALPATTATFTKRPSVTLPMDSTKSTSIGDALSETTVRIQPANLMTKIEPSPTRIPISAHSSPTVPKSPSPARVVANGSTISLANRTSPPDVTNGYSDPVAKQKSPILKRANESTIQMTESLCRSTFESEDQTASLGRYAERAKSRRSSVQTPPTNNIQEHELTAARQTRVTLEKQVELLRTQLTDAERKIADLQTINQVNKQPPDQSVSPTIMCELHELRRKRQELALNVTHLQSELDETLHELSIARQARQRAEQNAEHLRLDLSRVTDERDAEMEAIHQTHQTRMRALEEKLENAQREATFANQQRLQLEQDLTALREKSNAVLDAKETEAERKLQKEINKYQTLLAEKEAMLEQARRRPVSDQQTIKQLRDRVDELDELNEANNRQKRAMQVKLDEHQTQLTVLQRIKRELEDQLSSVKRDTLDLTTQVEDHQEAVKTAQRKYQAVITDRSIDLATIEAQAQEISDLLKEREALRTELHEYRMKLHESELDQSSRASLDRMERKVHELQQRLEMETLTHSRLQTSLDRARDTIDQITSERDTIAASDNAEKQLTRRLSRQLREAELQLEQTARRAQLAERRTEEALTQTDQAMHQAASSRAELRAMTRRTQELEAWMHRNEMELGSVPDYTDDVHSYPIDNTSRKPRCATASPPRESTAVDRITLTPMKPPVRSHSYSHVLNRTRTRRVVFEDSISSLNPPKQHQQIHRTASSPIQPSTNSTHLSHSRDWNSTISSNSQLLTSNISDNRIQRIIDVRIPSDLSSGPNGSLLTLHHSSSCVDECDDSPNSTSLFESTEQANATRSTRIISDDTMRPVTPLESYSVRSDSVAHEIPINISSTGTVESVVTPTHPTRQSHATEKIIIPSRPQIVVVHKPTFVVDRQLTLSGPKSDSVTKTADDKSSIS